MGYMKILVRNLNRNTTEEHLRDLFKPFGTLTDCVLVMDEKTGKSKGFGFVEMPLQEEAKNAIKKLNGKVFQGVVIRVKTTNKIHRG